MKSFIVVVLLVTYSLSCRSSDKSAFAKEDSLAMETVQEFYQWYIYEVYPQGSGYYQVPRYEKVDRVTYIFDIDDYQKRLSSVEFFSNGYKKKLIDRIRKCNQAMREVKWEYEPEPMFNIEQCNYLWGNQWVGGQGERVNGFKVESIVVNDGEAHCIVNILIDDKVFVRSILNLSKFEDEYKITNISLDWKKD